MVCVGGGLDEDEAREPVMMKQITTTTTQVGNVQTPQENLLCTNFQSISNQRGTMRDSASEVRGQKLSSEAREDEEDEDNQYLHRMVNVTP